MEALSGGEGPEGPGRPRHLESQGWAPEERAAQGRLGGPPPSHRYSCECYCCMRVRRVPEV